MTFANFISIVRARWWLVLVVVVVTTVTALVVSLLMPKKYVATATLVIDVKPDPITPIFSGLNTPSFMATQVDILGSDRVALRVVRNLKLAENPDIVAQWREASQGEGTVEQWLVGLFQRSVDIRPSKESNVIGVAYRAPDPRFAAVLANAFVQAYIDTTLELRVDPAKQYNNFFDQRAQATRDALEAAQAKLSAFQRTNGIAVDDQRLDVETARLNELSSQLVTFQALSAESSSRQAQATGASAERLQEVLMNPVIGSLKAELSRTEAKLQELNTRYGDNFPEVIQAKANIAEMRSRIEAETRRVTGGAAVSNTINRQREAETRAALEAQRSKVLKIKALRDQASVLMRDVESAQRAFGEVSARLSQSVLESHTTQSNVNMLSQATPPTSPASPKTLLNTVLAMVVGGILGLGLVLLLELLDRRVRGVVDLIETLKLPLLGVMPKPGTRRAGAQRLLGMEQRVLGTNATPNRGAA